MFSFAPFPPILPPLVTLFKENKVVVTFRRQLPPPLWPANPTQQGIFRIWNDVLTWSNWRQREAAWKEKVSEKRVRMEMMVLDHFIEKTPLFPISKQMTDSRCDGSEHTGSHTGEQGGRGGKKWRGRHNSKGIIFNAFLRFLYSSFSSPCVMT